MIFFGGKDSGVALSTSLFVNHHDSLLCVHAAPGCGCSCNVREIERRKAYDSGAKSYDKDIEWDEWWMGITSMRKDLMYKAKGSVLEVISNVSHMTTTS